MEKGKLPFKEQEEKSLKENLDLFNRAKNLKKRALKIIKMKESITNENIES